MQCPKCGAKATSLYEDGEVRAVMCDECDWEIRDYKNEEKKMDASTRCMWCGSEQGKVFITAGRPNPVVHWVACESCFERVINGARPNERGQGGTTPKRSWFRRWVLNKAQQIVLGGGAQ